MRLVFWDGEAFDLGPQPKIVITLTTTAILRRLLRGDIDALGDAYVDGTLTVEGRLQEFSASALNWRPGGRFAWIGRVLGPVGKLARWRRFRHTREADAAAISHHYDVSNEFYALWLDRNLIYSCAYFPTGAEDIDAAQEAKLDHICRKLRLQPGERLLDIGCGWGGTGRAARNDACPVLGITLSERQRDEAQGRVASAGLAIASRSSRCDYRDIAGEGAFDKIVSVGMYEHVGIANLPLYFGAIHRLLKVGGLALNRASRPAIPRASRKAHAALPLSTVTFFQVGSCRT